MRVIVTRPEPSASLTAEKVRALGHEPMILPLFEAHHLAKDARAALSQPAAGLVLTSAEAARVLLTLRDVLPPFLEKPLFAVGEATARAARELGFINIRLSGGNGAALADLIASEVRPSTPLLYLAGEPRSPGLEERLTQLGVAYHTVVIYRMAAIHHAMEELDDLVGKQGPCAVLLYSREAALRFASILGTQDLDARYLCLSHVIADALPPALRAKALIAELPREDRLLALLDRA